MDQLIGKLKELLKEMRWGIGASKLLNYYGITETINDLDLVVALKDHDHVCLVLRRLGKEIHVPNKDEYVTERFSRFEVDGIEIDVMSDFRIKHDKGLFSFSLEPIHYKNNIPLTSLEEWYLAYLLMKGRNQKIKMLEDYFLNSRSLDIGALKTNRNLPDSIVKHIEDFIVEYETKPYKDLIEIIQKNDDLMAVFNALDHLDLDCYIGAGAIVQTIWNFKTNKALNYGISDIDIIFYDPHKSHKNYEEEVRDKILGILGKASLWLDVKNQARVHLWYEEKFGYPIDPYTSLESAIDTWPTTATALGLRRNKDDWQIYAPFGLDDLMSLRVVANNRQITEGIYENKKNKWLSKWQELEIKDWDNQRIPITHPQPIFIKRNHQYMGGKDYWNKKFKARTKQLSPDEELVNNIKKLKKGSVLDIACGDGRNAMYLLSKGYRVTGIDFSDEALKLLKIYSHDQVKTIQVDLNKDHALKMLESFDSVVINHYRLAKKHMGDLKQILNKHGTIFVTGFSQRHKPDQKISSDDLIDLDDFKGLGMTLFHTHEYSDDRGSFITYIFKN